MSARQYPPRYCDYCDELDPDKLEPELTGLLFCKRCAKQIADSAPSGMIGDEEWRRMQRRSDEWIRACFEIEKLKQDPSHVIQYAEYLFGHNRGTDKDVLEADDWWFVPTGYIGSHGIIIDKHCNDIYTLGSIGSTFTYLRSYDSGERDELFDLEFTEIHDFSRTLEALESAPLLKNTTLKNCPMSLEWISKDELRRCMDSLPFSFEAQPFLRETLWSDPEYRKDIPCNCNFRRYNRQS